MTSGLRLCTNRRLASPCARWILAALALWMGGCMVLVACDTLLSQTERECDVYALKCGQLL